MKKQVLLFGLFLTNLLIRAQVPNSSFENLNPNGTIKQWGSLILIPIVLDTNGNSTDSLIIDNQFYFSTNDAHTGTKALEMRNAKWQINGGGIAGQAHLFDNDTAYNIFSVPVSFFQNPVNFTFYYKFFPVNSDTAYAWMRLTDSTFNLIGEASIEIMGTHSLYTQASTPVVYYMSSPPAFLEIGFTTSKPTSAVNYGTRFLVDDVGFTGAIVTGSSPLSLNSESLECFPNPAEKEVFLRLKKVQATEPAFLRILNAEGNVVKELSAAPSGPDLRIGLEDVAPGLYFVNVIHAGYTYTARFVK